jgi:hypothetical protein
MALKALYPTRDLMQKVIDRLGLYDKPQTDIANPLALLPYINFNIDVDELCKEPNYEFLTVPYSAAAGWKPIWTVPDDEIVQDIQFGINTQDAIRTITILAVAEDDVTPPGSRYIDLYSTAATQYVQYTPALQVWRQSKHYPGETFWAYFDVNIAGGDLILAVRYIRLKTKEVLL